MLVFKHPKYYQELRKKRKEFLKEQAELQAASAKGQAVKEQADPDTDSKDQAPSGKGQA